MKKNSVRIVSLLLVLVISLLAFVSCKDDKTPPAPEQVDYVSGLKLDMSSDTKKAKVTVHLFVDGDTTHFNIDDHQMFPTGIIKARYLAVNTPESTGKIEPFGHKASEFTRSKLESAKSIIIESDTTSWKADSTGSRYMLWIWYQPEDGADYRNLNLEILQNGLALASKTGDNRYGDTCTKALAQAQKLKLNVYSSEKDPDMYYGDAITLSLKELRMNPETYKGKDVAFEATVYCDTNHTVYLADYDEETGLYIGMPAYYGFNASPFLLEFLSPGNRVRIVGNLQYYEAGGTYQVSDLRYDVMEPDSDANCRLIKEGTLDGFPEIDPHELLTGKVTVEVDSVDEEGNEIVTTKEFTRTALSVHTAARMTGLKVVDAYTTSKGDSKGAMTLTCEYTYTDANGATKTGRIDVRTTVLYENDDTVNGAVITSDAYMGKTINVSGFIDYYDGSYQLKTYAARLIEVVG